VAIHHDSFSLSDSNQKCLQLQSDVISTSSFNSSEAASLTIFQQVQTLLFQERKSKSTHLQSKDGHRFKSVTQVEKFPLSQATSETQDTSGIPRSLPVRPAKIGSL